MLPFVNESGNADTEYLSDGTETLISSLSQIPTLNVKARSSVFRYKGNVCRITHHNEEAYVGALAMLAAIRSLAFQQSSGPERLFQSIIRYLPDSRVRDRIVELAAFPEDPSVADVACQFGSSGYVVDSVPLALYAARSIAYLPLGDVFRVQSSGR